MLSILLVAQTTVAQDSCSLKAKECEEILEIANKIIKDQNKQIIDQAVLIEEQSNLNKETYKQLQEEQKSNGAWYRNPVNMILIGIAVGVVGGAYVSK